MEKIIPNRQGKGEENILRGNLLSVKGEMQRWQADVPIIQNYGKNFKEDAGGSQVA